MSAVPELKQKKIARDQANAKAAKEAAAKAVSDEAALNKVIYSKAQAYEQEYEKVGTYVDIMNMEYGILERECRLWYSGWIMIQWDAIICM